MARHPFIATGVGVFIAAAFLVSMIGCGGSSGGAQQQRAVPGQPNRPRHSAPAGPARAHRPGPRAPPAGTPLPVRRDPVIIRATGDISRIWVTGTGMKRT